MDPVAFKLETLKSLLDDTFLNAQKQVAFSLKNNTRIQVESISVTFGLMKNSDGTFGFAKSDFANPIHTRYKHRGKSGSNLELYPLGLGENHV